MCCHRIRQCDSDIFGWFQSRIIIHDKPTPRYPVKMTRLVWYLQVVRCDASLSWELRFGAYPFASFCIPFFTSFSPVGSPNKSAQQRVYNLPHVTNFLSPNAPHHNHHPTRSPNTTVTLSRRKSHPGRLPSIATHSGHFGGGVYGSFGSSVLTIMNTRTQSHNSSAPAAIISSCLVWYGFPPTICTQAAA